MTFIDTPILRGFTEIAGVHAAAETHGAVICGGYARYAASRRVSPAPASDVDVFPIRPEATAALRGFFEAEGFTVAHETAVSVSLKRPEKMEERETNWRWATCPNLQLIKPVTGASIQTFGQTEEILRRFDFSVTRAAIVSPTFALVDEDFHADDEKNRLHVKNVVCPISSVMRAGKYAKKGYWLPPSEAMRIFADWDARDPEYRARMAALFARSAANEITEQEVEELESMLLVD